MSEFWWVLAVIPPCLAILGFGFIYLGRVGRGALPGTKRIEPALARLGLSKAPRAVPAVADFQVSLQVSKGDASFPILEKGAKEAVFGDRYDLVFEQMVSTEGGRLFDGMVLSSRYAHHARPKLEPSSHFSDFYYVSVRNENQWALLTPRVRSLFLKAYPLELKRGRLYLSLVGDMMATIRVRTLAERIGARYQVTCELLAGVRHPAPLAVKFLTAAALDSDADFRARAALQALVKLEGATASVLARSLAERLQAFAHKVAVADLPKAPGSLPALLLPVLNTHPSWLIGLTDDGEESPGSYCRGVVGVEDVGIEPLLVLANLFPEWADDPLLVAKIPNLSSGSEALLSLLLDRLDPAAQDRLLFPCLTLPNLWHSELRHYFYRRPERFTRMEALFYSTSDLCLWINVMRLFFKRRDQHVRIFLARAVPHILAMKENETARETLLTTVLHGLAEVGEEQDLATITRCRQHIHNPFIAKLGRQAFLDVCRRHNLNHEGQLSVVTTQACEGALSHPEEPSGRLSTAPDEPDEEGNG